jgi:cytochrome c peroxidase
VPPPPKGAYEPKAARRGERLFNTTAKCATCHVPPIFTEPGWNLHTAEEIGIDDFQALRAPDERYRTVPLRALWNTKIHKGGFYHDGRFGTLREVVDHYDGHFGLNLSEDHKRDLIEYLKSL